jgi:hypothetical protein
MATGLALPRPPDPVRIVPLAQIGDIGTVDRQAPQGPPQHLTHNGGAIIGSVEVITIFWGEAWTTDPTKAFVARINDFFDAILVSPLLDQLGEYGLPGDPINHGRRTASAVITTPALGSSISDGALQHFLEQEIAANAEIPKPSADTLYFVYLPPGVSVAQGGAHSCQAFCGYHNDIKGRIFYAVMPYPSCKGCTGSLRPFDALTTTSSHELCEAITDPVPGQGWYDNGNNEEVGDLCAWQTKQVAGFTVQLEWSNARNTCY